MRRTPSTARKLFVVPVLAGALVLSGIAVPANAFAKGQPTACGKSGDHKAAGGGTGRRVR